jgi:outer membrane protein assembly factor BamB
MKHNESTSIHTTSKVLTAGLTILVGAAAPLLAQPQAGTLLWTCNASGSNDWSPALTLALDGTVYTGGLTLTAVTNDGCAGSIRWRFFWTPSSAVVVADDATIYLPDCSLLFAINPDGSEKWRLAPEGRGGTSPSIGFDNTIYFGPSGSLYAFSPSGATNWVQYIGGLGPLGVSIGPDRTIYAGFEHGLSALNPDGTVKWSLGVDVLGQSFQGGSAPSIGADGTIYVSAGALYAFNPAGSNLWSSGNNFTASVIIAQDGTLYAASSTGKRLHALAPTGQESWAALDGLPPQPGATTVYTVPALDAGGTVYYCTSNCVWALNPQGQVQWTVAASDPRAARGYEVANVSPIIGPDGTLYAAMGHTLYAIATGTNGPANSPWPMDRQNARNTGKVEKPALRQPQKRSDANFQFQLYGQLGQTFTIQGSTNLANWTSLTSVVATTLPMDVADLTATNAPLRFYRASSPP